MTSAWARRSDQGRRVAATEAIRTITRAGWLVVARVEKGIGMATQSDLVDRRANVLTVLLRVAAAACAIDVVAGVVRLVDISRAGEAVRSTAGESVVASARYQAVFNGVVALVGLLVLVWLVTATRRRAPGSRGGVWGVAAVLCAAMVFGAATDSGTVAAPDVNQSAPLRAALEQLTPGWYGPVHSLVAGTAVISLIVAAVTVSRISAIDYYG